jgi:hypothetical protein
MNSFAFFVSVALALTFSACGPSYGVRVPPDMLGSLTYENRVDLLEPENEVALAVDKLDEAENDVERTRQSLRRAKSRAQGAHEEEGQAKDDPSREVASLAIAEAESRIEYLRAKQEVNLRERRAEELNVRCALAHFEESRLQVLRKYKIKGSERLRPDDFTRQSKECQAELARLRDEVGETLKAAQAAEQTWTTHKTAVAKRTFDARASPYVE